MKWNGRGGGGQAGGRIWKMSHSETTKESPDGVPFFPSATNSEDKGGEKCRTFFGRQESSLFSRTRWLTGALRVQCNWARKSAVFLSPLMCARQKQPPVSLENVGDISERKKSGAVVGFSQLEQPIGDHHRGRGTADTLYAVFFRRRSSCVRSQWQLRRHRRDPPGAAAAMWYECTGAQRSTRAATEGNVLQPMEV